MADSATAGSRTAAISEMAHLIDFENFEVIAPIVNDTYYLFVSGTKPYINMKVELVPVIYTHQPEYWRIEVTGLLPGYGLPALAPYLAELDISGYRGTKGIEIVGATKTERIDIGSDSEEDHRDLENERNLGEWSAKMDLSGFVPQVEVNGDFPADEKPLYELIVKPQRRPAELNLELTFGYLVNESAQSRKQVYGKFPAGSADQYRTVRVSDADGRTIARVEVQPDPNS